MSIREIVDPPLRSQGLTQPEYSAQFEAFMTSLPLAVADFNAAANAYQLAVTGTSTTSVAIGTGSKSFTTQTGLAFSVGMTLRIANNSTNYMTGDVTSYTTGTGVLVVNVTSVVGSGTLASWTISLAAVGANTAGAVSFTPAGNIAATNVQNAIQELDTEKLSSAAGAVTGTNLEDITTAETVGSSYLIPVVTFDVNGRATSKTTAQKIILGTATASTSGTSIDFTSISASAKKVTINFVGVSTNGTSNPLIQIGDSGGIETTTYLGAGSRLSNGVAVAVANYTTGFGIATAADTNVIHGSLVLTLVDSATNTWVASGNFGLSSSLTVVTTAGSKALSAVLDRVRITTVNGTDAFDAGLINILVE